MYGLRFLLTRMLWYNFKKDEESVMAMNLVQHPRISIDPNVCHGKPVIAGTRIIVSQLLDALASGASQVELLEDYPSLKLEDIQAALSFASDLSKFQEVPTGCSQSV